MVSLYMFINQHVQMASKKKRKEEMFSGKNATGMKKMAAEIRGGKSL